MFGDIDFDGNPIDNLHSRTNNNHNTHPINYIDDDYNPFGDIDMDGNALENPTMTAVGSTHGDIATLPSSSSSAIRSVEAVQVAPTSDAILSLADLIWLYPNNIFFLNNSCDFVQLKVDPKLPGRIHLIFIFILT